MTLVLTCIGETELSGRYGYMLIKQEPQRGLMMSNPPNDYITPEMWYLWENRPNPDWKLSGIYADKKGYHNTVIANQKKWPDNYSIKLPLDLVDKNRNKARAIDLTMSDSEMIRWTTRMKKAAENAADTRLSAVKEFYGTLDGKSVFGLAKDSEYGPWRRSTADSSHLWHSHTSIFTAFVDNSFKLNPLLSVWKGESLRDWSLSQMQLPKQGDVGQSVLYWQYLHNKVRNHVSPPAPLLKTDGDYGAATAAAFSDFWKKSGGEGSFSGAILTGWLGVKYHEALAVISAPKPSSTGPTPEQIKEAVNTWLSQNIPANLRLTGAVDAIVTFK